MGSSDKVVYTAVTASYDELKPPAVVEEDVDYLVFSDDPGLPVPPPWQLRPLERAERNPRVTSRRCKLLPHRYLAGYGTSLWIDATKQIVAPISAWMDELATRTTFAAFAHSERQCAFEEAKVVSERHLDYPDMVDLQMSYYRSQGFPAELGLIEASILFRRHNDEAVSAAMEDWWRQIQVFTQRDQLGVSFVLWRHRLAYEELPGTVLDNAWFRHTFHVHAKTHLGIESPRDEIDWLRAAAIDALAGRRAAHEVRDTAEAAARAAIAECREALKARDAAAAERQIAEIAAIEAAAERRAAEEARNAAMSRAAAAETAAHASTAEAEALRMLGHELRCANEALKLQRAALLNSSSWRVTAPLRRLRSAFGAGGRRR